MFQISSPIQNICHWLCLRQNWLFISWNFSLSFSRWIVSRAHWTAAVWFLSLNHGILLSICNDENFSITKPECIRKDTQGNNYNCRWHKLSIRLICTSLIIKVASIVWSETGSASHLDSTRLWWHEEFSLLSSLDIWIHDSCCQHDVSTIYSTS